jgi:hypothetical protein
MEGMSRALATAAPVWAATITAVVILAVTLPAGDRVAAVAVTAAAAVLLAFIVQVAFQRTDGVVTRLLISVVGIVMIGAVASGLMLILPALD